MSQKPLRYAAVFISDVHLGMKGVHARELVEFLQNVEADRIYINGDMIDELRLVRRKMNTLPYDQSLVLETLCEKESSGSGIIYIAGNHERSAGKSDLLSGEEIYTDPLGKTFLIRHGEIFGPFLSEPSERTLTVGLKVYEFMIAANNILDRAAQKILSRHFSAVTTARKRSESVLNMIRKFETAAVASTAGQNVDGIICGHIHFPALKETGGKIYANTGDWVEHCSVLAVTHDGQWEQFDWRKKRRSLKLKEKVSEPREASRKKARALLKSVLG